MTGVSESLLLDLLPVLGESLTEFLRNALADSKSEGINFTRLPLTSGTLVHEPSTKDLEHCCTVLARFSHCDKDSGFSPRLISTGVNGVAGVVGESMTDKSSFMKDTSLHVRQTSTQK